MNRYVSAKDFFANLSPEGRVYLLVRHGERRHITPQDPDSGAHVGLTDAGRRQAFDLGTMFPKEGDAVYFSSPVGRCVETARRIGEGRASVGGPVAAPVQVLQPLGDFFVRDFEQYRAVLNENFYPSICRWIEKGEHPAYCPLASRAEEMRQMMLEKGTARFNVFTSHDAWIVPCLAHFCHFNFTPGVWMNFLTGLAIVVEPGALDRIVPITGLNDGNLLF
ncbi:MAG: histidine phosphatase family protein [Fibrobacter sp.]|nr:histidine phosphatase family protein [Fibrobacter sp.]